MHTFEKKVLNYMQTYAYTKLANIWSAVSQNKIVYLRWQSGRLSPSSPGFSLCLFEVEVTVFRTIPILTQKRGERLQIFFPLPGFELGCQMTNQCATMTQQSYFSLLQLKTSFINYQDSKPVPTEVGLCLVPIPRKLNNS